jgi:septal ring factor EnvC (AmiA/AmiB activator)
MQKMVLIGCAALILCGCDTKKEERNTLRSELDGKLNSLAQVEKKIRDVEAIQANVSAEVTTFNGELVKDEANIKENKDSLASYVLNHKLAVAAVAATGAGIAGILADNLDDQERGAAVAAGILGAGYCLFSDGECSDATAKVTYYGGQIAYYKDDANKKTDAISTRRQKLAELEQSNAPLLAERATFLTNIDALKSQIASLTCSGLLCF